MNETLADGSGNTIAQLSRPTRTTPHVYGAMVLTLYLLATTRWGSYILPGPPYVADFVVALLLVDRLLALPNPGHVFPPIDPWIRRAVLALLSLTVVALALGPLTTDAIRDAAIFLYGIVVFLAPRLSNQESHRATSLINVCLYFHLTWTTVILIVPAVGSSFPTAGNPLVDIFSARSDIDGLVNGLAASLGLYRLLQNKDGMVLFVWGLTLVLISHSRIALVATAVLMLCVMVYVRPQASPWWSRMSQRLVARNPYSNPARPRSISAVAGLSCVIAIIALAAAPTSVERLGATFGEPAPPRTDQGGAAAGTTEARLKTWERLGHWMVESNSRMAVGFGFGPNIMLESEAGLALVHAYDPSLRAPHNVLLTIWAHLGILGLLIAIFVLMRGFQLSISIRNWPDRTDVDVLAALIVVGIPIISVAGVVLESPFGAVPYFWALGYLSASRYACHDQRGRPPKPGFPIKQQVLTYNK